MHQEELEINWMLAKENQDLIKKPRYLNYDAKNATLGARKSIRVFTQDTTSLEQRITQSFGQKELLKNHWQSLQYLMFSRENAFDKLLNPSPIAKDKSKNRTQARLF